MLAKIKKVKSKKIIIFFIVCLFVCAPMAIPEAKPARADDLSNDLQRRITDTRASVTATANRRRELERTIASLRNQQASAINEKRIYDNLIADIESEIRETGELIELYIELIAHGESEIQRAQEEYDRSYALFLEMIKFAYEEGTVDYLGMLLKSESFMDFLSRIDIIASMLEYNKNVISSLQQSRETLEITKKAHEEAMEQQDEYVRELEEISKEVEGWRTRAEEAIAQTNRDLQQNIAAQAEFEQEERAAQAEITRLTRELQARQESLRRYVGGTFLWPLPVERNRISSGFGNRRSPITGRPEHHNGIDIPAPRGTSIFAVNDGIVIIAGWSNGYGNYIVIDHGGGKSTMYAHNTTNNVKVGDNVKRGDVIGTVGTTGWSTGNHLHFGFYQDGVPKNPLLNGLTVP